MKVYPELVAGEAAFEARIALTPDGEERAQLVGELKIIKDSLRYLRGAGYGGIEEVVHGSDHLES